MPSQPFSFTAAAVALTLFAGCSQPENESAAVSQTPLVEAVAARSGALPVEETVPGVVRARNQVVIRPEVPGRVVDVLVRSGDAVRRDQPLVRLDDSEPRERMRQAEADVRLAEAAAAAARARAAEVAARVSRTRTLANQSLVSAQELETLEAQLAALEASAEEADARVEQRRAALDETRSALEKTVVRAPVAGRLGERRAEVGMLVGPATELFVVGDLGELIVEVDLTEAMLGTVEEGLPVVIEGRGPTFEPVRAQLSRISPFLAAESFTTRGEIDVANQAGRLRPGMFVSVRILVGQSREATLVPVSSVWEDPISGERGVFVIENGSDLAAASSATDREPEHQVSFRPVEVLAEGRGAAGVTRVEEGDWVVTVGQHLLAAELRAAAGADARAAGELPETARAAARIRPVAWERILELQQLQNEDLLEDFLDKQRKVAAALGTEIPASEDVVNRVLEAAERPKAEG